MKRNYKQLPRKNHAFKWVDHPLYNTWCLMKSRCYNPKHTQYKDWGGRGIKVCKQWKYDFEQFVKDMGEKISGDYSIDRIKNNKNYKPSNCRWATRLEQNRNKRVYVKNNTGYSGVIKLPHGGFQTRSINTRIILGVFKTLKQALKAQKKNKKQDKPRLNNTTGLKGVTLKDGTYRVRKVINGVRMELGSTKSLEEAKKIYDSGEKKQTSVANTTGLKGVTIMKNGQYRVRKTIDGVRKSLGTFNTLDECEVVLNENS